ncbi:MAG TPA: outer membrane beta-barrel protein [Pyrinomonadaceae bacterium]
MKRLVLLTSLVLFSFATSFAQTSNDKKPEFFGGYSFENIDSGVKSNDLSTSTTLEDRFRANGFHVAGTGYLTKRFGITGDFSGHFQSRDDLFGTTATTGRSKLSLFNLTGGPQFRLPNHTKFTPFVQGLAGIARHNFTETISTTPFNDNTTNFALNLGGGVDYKLNNRFAWRIAQFDYNPIFLRARTIDTTALPDRTLNGFRFSTGIVIR